MHTNKKVTGLVYSVPDNIILAVKYSSHVHVELSQKPNSLSKRSH
jgi:long-subunit fatty acid transport protein